MNDLPYPEHWNRPGWTLEDAKDRRERDDQVKAESLARAQAGDLQRQFDMARQALTDIAAMVIDHRRDFSDFRLVEYTLGRLGEYERESGDVLL